VSCVLRAPLHIVFVLDLVLNGRRNGLILRSAVSGQNDQTAAQGHVTDGQRRNIVGLASIGGLDDAIDKFGEFVLFAEFGGLFKSPTKFSWVLPYRRAF
jgi:hypothetical protein